MPTICAIASGIKDFRMFNLYVIYRPTTKDNPGKWVLRRWHVSLSGGVRPETTSKRHNSLEEARGSLPPNLYRLTRDDNDDECIEETWIALMTETN